MCGIAGAFHHDPERPIAAATVAQMCAVIRHRGPDDQGVYCNGSIGLGARRLSIIDLATGNQPIHNEDQSVWVVYNGEIYNFRELRAELETHGHRFYTRTDTEVLVHLYEQYGAAMVHHLRGMFAIALWDARRRQLVLIRDRLGIKPLYYWLGNGGLLFGSELKSLLQAPEFIPAVDPEAINRYISLGYIADPDSIFAGVKKLPPGHLLVAGDGKIRLEQYWDLPEPDLEPPTGEEQVCERIQQLLRESVKMRLISDVPLGALLSGGLDSSVVVALMAEFMDRPVKTFSIGFAEKDFSELKYARQVASHFGTEHRELVVAPQAVQAVESLMTYFDEPFGDPSAVPTYLVSQLARQSVTVALSGDGGDEIFAGYTRYIEARQQQLFDLLPRAVRRKALLPLSQALPYSAYGKNYLYRMAAQGGIDRYVDAATLPLAVKQQLIAPDFSAHLDSLDSAQVLRSYVPNGRRRGLLDKILYVDAKTELPGDILTKVDRMSMANSLEVRVPLLDHKLVEYVARLPLRYKMRGGITKYIFRKAFAHLLPPSVRRHAKTGFTIPLRHWFAKDMQSYLRDLLFDSQSLQRGYFRPEFLNLLVREHATGRRDHSYLLWRLLALEVWHRQVAR